MLTTLDQHKPHYMLHRTFYFNESLSSPSSFPLEIPVILYVTYTTPSLGSWLAMASSTVSVVYSGIYVLSLTVQGSLLSYSRSGDGGRTSGSGLAEPRHVNNVKSAPTIRYAGTCTIRHVCCMGASVFKE